MQTHAARAERMTRTQWGFLDLQIERLSGWDGCIVRQLAACALHNQEHCILRGQADTSQL